MNPDDYDDDGNNIVPCPLCGNVYCPSKEGGKCPDEEDFIKSFDNRNVIENQTDELGNYKN